jgi:hypothetical protein
MKYVLTVLMVLFAVSAQADIVGRVISTAQDENGNIMVRTSYFDNGVNVPSRYPMEGGLYYWVTRYSFQNFDGMDAKGIEARIKQDVDAFAQSLIAKEFTKAQNLAIDLKPIIGKEFTTTSTEVQVSQTKAIVVGTDGTSFVKTLTPPEPQPDMMAKLDELQAKLDSMSPAVEIMK